MYENIRVPPPPWVVSRIAFSHESHRDGSLEHPKHMLN